MLALAGWVGGLWDHGVDEPPGGSKVDRVADVVLAGMQGSKFWCEVAARTMTQSATAVGWPAPLVTVSNDGYDWDHAVTEVWSNQFQKWFAIDTDFNVVYEVDGVPLSSFELVNRRDALVESGELRVRQIAPVKPFFVARFGSRMPSVLRQLELFRYAHIDMRNDWVTRKLPRGSPAGGDLATWRTNSADLEPLLTVIPTVDEASLFDWPVNVLQIIPRQIESEDEQIFLELSLRGYSPYFATFELATNNGDWTAVSPDGAVELFLPTGSNTVRARIKTTNGGVGPETSVEFNLD